MILVFQTVGTHHFGILDLPKWHFSVILAFWNAPKWYFAKLAGYGKAGWFLPSSNYGILASVFLTPSRYKIILVGTNPAAGILSAD